MKVFRTRGTPTAGGSRGPARCSAASQATASGATLGISGSPRAFADVDAFSCCGCMRLAPPKSVGNGVGRKVVWHGNGVADSDGESEAFQSTPAGGKACNTAAPPGDGVASMVGGASTEAASSTACMFSGAGGALAARRLPEAGSVRKPSTKLIRLLRVRCAGGWAGGSTT